MISVDRLKATNEGAKVDSESILIHFEEDDLPRTVFLGFISYTVRAYIPKPLRCFNCQRLGHMAKNCKEKRRCARCGGDHEYGKCGNGVQPKCCSCGGAHSVAYAGCERMKQEKNIQKMRVEKKVSYAEAVKVAIASAQVNVNMGEGALRGHRVSQNDTNVIVVDKLALVTFIAGVRNTTSDVRSKNEKIQLIVKAAVNYLALVGLTWEEVRDNLNHQSSQET